MQNLLKQPSWMDKAFFTTVIKHHSSDASAEVKSFVIKPSSAQGFCSTMFQVKISFSMITQTDNVMSVVVKIPPMDGVKAEHSESSPVFATEQDMYSEPLRDIKTLLESVGDFSHINPKLIFQAITPHRVIVMEDLSVKGYCEIAQPLEDFEDSKMVFQRLAKLHAAGFYLIKERQADYSRFNYSLFKLKDSFIIEKLFDESLDTFEEVLKSWGDCNLDCNEYIEKLKVFRNEYHEIGQRLDEPDVNGYNVLNHGDFHTKNLLFKRNGNQIEDFYMLDFQAPVLASPCTDLFNALYNEVSDENRMKRRNEIIYEYHLEFTNCLKRFGFNGEIPSLMQLHIDLIKHGKIEVLYCICFKLFFWTDAANATVEEVIGSPNSKSLKTQIYNDPRYKKFIKMEFPRLLQMGFL